MKKTKVEEQGLGDFLGNVESVPSHVFTKTESEIRRQMKPGFFKVLRELLRVQVISGALTLLICPQFGIGPLGGGEGIMAWVSEFGHWVCGAYCGSVFVFLNVIHVRFFLGLDYLHAIRSNPILPYAALGAASLSTLVLGSFMWNKSVPHLHAEFVMAWFCAFVGLPALWLGIRFRKRLAE